MLYRISHPNFAIVSRSNELRLYDALSRMTASGTPVRLKNYNIASQMFFVLKDFSGYANGNDVAESHMAKI